MNPPALDWVAALPLELFALSINPEATDGLMEEDRTAGQSRLRMRLNSLSPSPLHIGLMDSSYEGAVPKQLHGKPKSKHVQVPTPYPATIVGSSCIWYSFPHRVPFRSWTLMLGTRSWTEEGQQVQARGGAFLGWGGEEKKPPLILCCRRQWNRGRRQLLRYFPVNYLCSSSCPMHSSDRPELFSLWFL